MKQIYKLCLLFLSLCSLAACVNQHPKEEQSKKKDRIVATSVAVAEICSHLNLDLVGVSDSKLYQLPERYDDVKRVGLPMNPDIEVIASLKPTWILSPNSLQNDLEPKYQKLKSEYGFLDLRSVEGMYQSIDDLGRLFHKENEARALQKDYHQFFKHFQAKNKHTQKPKVLVLMGLPGSYLVATDQSYVGNLVHLAGGDNCYHSEDKEFMTLNPEDMLQHKPDIILRTAHALPDQVKDMFAKEFHDNDIWKHFEAVQTNNVYDLDNQLFGMSAKLNYKEALEQLDKLLFADEKGV
ncbi:heme ABC transporter substrate-binding protein IsdE [Streptococcus iniae]|uniref:High-affinity heme uptake system protein IsdE n=1 Tax=Streptococcus iniae TaxID=1346 RepID=A0ABN4D9V2_STRIN|nr:heme ABC transporter substrate-binding protein IsdE [Streptococcus iniae]AHY16468.1 ABC transporter substrate-binding protein [Streptococcus iniae]AHY18331.1 ABC transporter substrate-binding protein [Streptococcus iniae]AJG26614.1 ABC transporter substrate-binding protein [Streptococcus iniae]APD32489.1 heme ABC transporter substrate-binding protein IsdE [Streptococcus iniae]ASL35455.1 heme-binding lipoprotein [Streptococcus iniae]